MKVAIREAVNNIHLNYTPYLNLVCIFTSYVTVITNYEQNV